MIDDSCVLNPILKICDKFNVVVCMGNIDVLEVILTSDFRYINIKMKIRAPCSLVGVDQRLRGSFCLHHSSPWWLWQYAPLKHRSTQTRLPGTTSQKVLIFIVAAVRTWNLANIKIFLVIGPDVKFRTTRLWRYCVHTIIERRKPYGRLHGLSLLWEQHAVLTSIGGFMSYSYGQLTLEWIFMKFSMKITCY
jgi:hypothetical protein